MTIESDKNIDKMYKNGVALCNNKTTLQVVKKPKLERDFLRSLVQGQFYPEQKFSYFVSEILPLLREHLKVDIASSKLPQAEFEQPRIVWNTKKEKHILTVTPVIAYGKPTIALVEKGILKLLGNSVPVRLFDKEQELIQFVSRTYPGAAVDHDMTFEGVDAVEFIGKMSSKRASFQGDAWEDFKKYPTLKLNLLSHFEKDLPVQFSTVDQGGQQKFADPNRVIEAWARDESLVPLLDGGWAQLPQKDLANYGAKIRDLLGSLNDNQEIPRCMFPTITQLYDDLETTVPEEFKHISSEITHAKNLANVIMPKEFKGTLRHYQNDGVKWISQLKSLELGALLADDMGLGKTLQTLCCIQRNTLIIAPTSVLQNWQEEISKFRPDLDCHLYYGPNRIFKPDASVNITSYSILRLDIEHLRNYTFDMVVLDEAQYIKNPKSQAAQASFQLNSRFRIALSGTPVENKLEDMWSLFHFLNKGLLSHYRDFQDRYAKPILAGDLNIAEQLRKRIEPFVMRRLKSEVAKELPPRTDIVRFCVLDEQEREVYDTMLLATKKEVLNELSKGKKIIQALEILLRLRQVACHLALLPNAENKSEYSSKVDLLLECLMSSIENNHKSLVFSQWTSFLDIIEKILIEKNIPFLRIDGQTKNRQEVVNRFQNESTIFVMLMSLKAAGVGLNLTAADHVFITDPWWNPAAENQAADRAHRIGQTNPVIVTRLVAQNTVEEKILLLQEKKKFLADSVVNAQGAQANLNKDDILELLN